jgi:PadR family transcriptional regulator, regulatory protein PadR
MNFKGSLTTLILQNLRQGPNHGYRIAQDIKKSSKGVLDFKEGTLYPALHGLEAKKLISSSTREEGGRTRRYYKLTDKGKKILVKERQEWLQLSGAISGLLQEGV